MNPIARLIPVAALSALLLARPAAADVKVGDKPALHFADFATKKSVDLGDLKGKIVVVDFWATWCHPCMAEAGHMVQVNRDYAPKGLQFIGVSLDSDPSAVPPVLKAKGFTWPQSYEGAGWTGHLPKSWGVTSIPQTFIIGPDGTVLWRGHPAEIDAPLAKAFKEHPPKLVDARTLATADKAITAADAAVDTDPAKAARLLGTVPSAAKADADTAAKFTAVADKLTAYGDAQLAEAQSHADAKEYGPAVRTYKALTTTLPGSPAAVTAKAKLATLMNDPAVRAAVTADKRNASADDALAAATKLKTAGKDEAAYAAFKHVASAYPNTPAATSAADAVSAYEADPAFAAKTKAKTDGRQSLALLAAADAAKSSGDVATAKTKYAEITRTFPGTPAAKTAQANLDKLGN